MIFKKTLIVHQEKNIFLFIFSGKFEIELIDFGIDRGKVLGLTLDWAESR